MGQPITVVETTSSANPAILRLETNRPLSGMGHDRYDGPPGELRRRPVDELARRLFAAGGVEGVHINGSVVTVTLRGGETGAGLADIVRQLFLHYGDAPAAPLPAPTDEADTAPDALADPSDAPAAQDDDAPAPDAADDAPAPDRPPAGEPTADQEIAGIPDAELEPASAAPPVEGEAASAPDGAGTGPPVEPTPDVERPVTEPLAADPAEVGTDQSAAAPAQPGDDPDASDG